MKNKNVFYLLASFIYLFIFSPNAFAITPTPTVTTGSISVCQIILNQNQQPVSGLGYNKAAFKISDFVPDPSLQLPTSPAKFPSQIFTLPLQLNARVLPSNGENDAECHTTSNLSLGSYYYTNETVASQDNWNTPQFNDFASLQSTALAGFHSYDDRLFSDPGHADMRNYQADGNIYLTEQSPNRTVAVFAQFMNHVAVNSTPSPTQAVIAAVDQTHVPNNSSANLTINPTILPTVQKFFDTKIIKKYPQNSSTTKLAMLSPSQAPKISISNTPSPQMTETITPSISPTSTPITATKQKERVIVDGFKGNENGYWPLLLFLIPLLIFFLILFWYKRHEKEEEVHQ